VAITFFSLIDPYYSQLFHPNVAGWRSQHSKSFGAANGSHLPSAPALAVLACLTKPTTCRIISPCLKGGGTMVFKLKKLFTRIDCPEKAAATNAADSKSKNGDYPFLSSSMIRPEDKIISTENAKKHYKKFMKRIKFHRNSNRLSFYANIFTQNLEAKERSLEYACKKDYDDLIINKKELHKLKENRSDLNDDLEKHYMTIKIKIHENTINELERSYEKNKFKYDEFMKNKKWFLVSYVNTEVHGDNWLEKYYEKYYSDLL
jgi:hypothetical protein